MDRYHNGFLISAVIVAAAMLALCIPTARAHAPHDVINLVEVSPDFTTDQTVIAVTLLSDHDLFARSLDGGRSWMEYASPVIGHSIRSLSLSPSFALDGTIFAATSNGIWRSTDHGLTWHAFNSGLTSLKIYDISVSPDFTVDQAVLAATKGGLFRSTDRGETWTRIFDGIVDLSVTAVSHVPDDAGTAFAGGKTIHRSNDGGLTWIPVQQFGHDLKSIEISPEFQSDSSMAVLLAGEDGILGSVDAGITWEPADAGLSDLNVNDVEIADDGTAFAVTDTEGCYRAVSILAPWNLFDEGFEKLSNQTEKHFRSIAASPQFSQDATIFVGAFEGLFKSVDCGESWKQCDIYNQRLCRRLSIPSNYEETGFLFAGNFGCGPMRWHGKGSSASPGFPQSAIRGKSKNSKGYRMSPCRSPYFKEPASGPPVAWNALGDPITSPWTSVLITSPDFAGDRTLFYAYMGLWRSIDGGTSWTEIPIPAQIPREIAFSPHFTADRILYMGTGKHGVYVSTDGGDTWQELTGGLPSDIHTKRIRLSPQFPADPTMYLASGDSGVWRSRNAGLTWGETSNGLTGDNVRAFDISPDFVNDRLLIAGLVRKGLFRSDDQGDSWIPISDDFPSGSDNVFEDVAFSPDFKTDRTVFAVSLYDGVFKSLDGGWNWLPAQTGLPL
ncbi:MAG: WD40/YVTN/BNR-like repeat-containing protein, partial [Planctomycetota bacterium]